MVFALFPCLSDLLHDNSKLLFFTNLRNPCKIHLIIKRENQVCKKGKVTCNGEIFGSLKNVPLNLNCLVLPFVSVAICCSHSFFAYDEMGGRCDHHEHVVLS